MEREIKLAYGSALLYAVLIGISFLFSKIALEYATPLMANKRYRCCFPLWVCFILW